MENDKKIDQLTNDVADLKSMVSEVVEAIHAFSAKVDQRFDDAHNELTKEIADVRRDLRGTEASLRDFIDRKVSDGVAEIAPVMRKVDSKDSALVDHLQAKKVIAPTDAEDILALSPFPNG